jgi:hypothetical protein
LRPAPYADNLLIHQLPIFTTLAFWSQSPSSCPSPEVSPTIFLIYIDKLVYDVVYSNIFPFEMCDFVLEDKKTLIRIVLQIDCMCHLLRTVYIETFRYIDNEAGDVRFESGSMGRCKSSVINVVLFCPYQQLPPEHKT